MRCVRFLLPCLVAILLWIGAVPGPIVAREAPDTPEGHVHNVRVALGTLEGATGSAPLAIQVSGGGRILFTTAEKAPQATRWQHRIRVFTRHDHPLVFRVIRMEPDAAALMPPPQPAPRPQRRPAASARPALPEPEVRRQDRILAEGFDDLIGDFDLPDARDRLEALARTRRAQDIPERRNERPSTQVATDGGVLCTVTLAWPPADGEHSLACGDMTLRVRTTRLAEGGR